MLRVTRKENNELRLSFENIQRLNILNQQTIHQEVYDYLTANDTNVVVDLEGIRFIDSTGFSYLIGLNKWLKKNGKEFYLANPHPEVVELISLMKLDEILKIYPN
jgi:anti-anti-sigma factor